MAEHLEELVVALAEDVRGRVWGKYRGTVEAVLDEEPPGQLTARVPSVYGADASSPPALPCLPFAGDGHGLVTLPEVGDGVWIEFEAGDISRPIWTGFWFANDELPADAGPRKRALITKAGLKLIFDDEADAIHLAHSGGAEIVLEAGGLTLRFGDSVKLVLSGTGIDFNDGAYRVSAL